jgi:hypothetical protein
LFANRSIESNWLDKTEPPRTRLHPDLELFPNSSLSVGAQTPGWGSQVVPVSPVLDRSADRAQVWRLNAANRPSEEPWDFLKRFAEHNDRSADDVWDELKLSATELARDSLS